MVVEFYKDTGVGLTKIQMRSVTDEGKDLLLGVASFKFKFRSPEQGPSCPLTQPHRTCCNNLLMLRLFNEIIIPMFEDTRTRTVIVRPLENIDPSSSDCQQSLQNIALPRRSCYNFQVLTLLQMPSPTPVRFRLP